MIGKNGGKLPMVQGPNLQPAKASTTPSSAMSRDGGAAPRQISDKVVKLGKGDGKGGKRSMK